MTTLETPKTPKTPKTLKNKTLVVWLALLAGTLGLHRFYLKGLRNGWGWLYLLPTGLGCLGVYRMRILGQNDEWAWWLAPWLGLTLFAACLSAIIYALTEQTKWNRLHNPQMDDQHPVGATSWFTIIGLIVALMVGTTALMTCLAMVFGHYFEMTLKP